MKTKYFDIRIKVEKEERFMRDIEERVTKEFENAAIELRVLSVKDVTEDVISEQETDVTERCKFSCAGCSVCDCGAGKHMINRRCRSCMDCVYTHEVEH